MVLIRRSWMIASSNRQMQTTSAGQRITSSLHPSKRASKTYGGVFDVPASASSLLKTSEPLFQEVFLYSDLGDLPTTVSAPWMTAISLCTTQCMGGDGVLNSRLVFHRGDPSLACRPFPEVAKQSTGPNPC